jgi:superfamily II DNA helicase RecQ
LPLCRLILRFQLKICVLTLGYDRRRERFDDSELERFMETAAEVIDVREHFFTCDSNPVWVLLLSYRDAGDLAPMAPRRTLAGRDAVKQELSAEEVTRFESARAWRNARAGRDGKPPYVLLTNRQLATLAKRNPTDLNALSEVEGIGENKLHEFGSELLEVLKAGQAVLQKGDTGNADSKTSVDTHTLETHAGDR